MCERILVGDCTTTKPDGLFHAVLCDPPYELGFMGKDWDASGIAFNPETWRRIGEHLHPGAFLMAFASSRGWHRLACAIEDAGFIIHPTIFGWSFGSGFPKATRIDRAVKANGEGEREIANYGMKNRCTKCGKPFFSGNPCLCPKPKSEHPFAGHRYGLQALKPAVEPIIVAQKPYSGKPVDCITRTGAGALAIDAGRIGTDAGWSYPNGAGGNGFHGGVGRAPDGSRTEACASTGGRWPANFILLDEEAAAALDRQSAAAGMHSAGCAKEHDRPRGQAVSTSFGGGQDGTNGGRYGDTGGASRFFYNVQSQLDAADPIRYQAKASRSQREEGLLGKAPCRKCGGLNSLTHIEKRNKAKSGMERMNRKNAEQDYRPNDYVKEGEIEEVEVDCVRCDHPTVKPIDLARYLATLLLPPADYAPRRILVPFSGVGSEMIGAMLAGWEEVVGIEQDAEYAEIARLRLAHWSANKPQEPAPEPELALEPTT
jgi:site-specific DNA-methyltransferase (adenine-specific)